MCGSLLMLVAWVWQDSTAFTGYEEDDPQGKGSPIGFLGLGNLDIEGFPGRGLGQQATAKACLAVPVQVIPCSDHVALSVQVMSDTQRLMAVGMHQASHACQRSCCQHASPCRAVDMQ